MEQGFKYFKHQRPKHYQKDTLGKKLLDISRSNNFVKSISPHQKLGIISNVNALKIPSSKVNNSQTEESAYGQGEDIHRSYN